MVNMITAGVQQVTTCSQVKEYDWEVQGEICNAVKTWVEKANEANVEHMWHESAAKASTLTM